MRNRQLFKNLNLSCLTDSNINLFNSTLQQIPDTISEARKIRKFRDIPMRIHSNWFARPHRFSDAFYDLEREIQKTSPYPTAFGGKSFVDFSLELLKIFKDNVNARTARVALRGFKERKRLAGIKRKR